MIRDEPKLSLGWYVAVGLTLAMALTVLGTVGFVAGHFIGKFW